ncbi:hypothetical protein E1262_03515 [Jiangella aurantiaca]|uniref:Alkaline phosphatase family protein n=1 Tax=Jiangella aurantiaca TaxID=2530373 RepID=A0A4R5AMY2_9ACTN|nr:hypothetical protein [Jiangella aurantiaca]TDD72384.1 hypothetical protein E1262_03515 [Jiangella aurantiaca]
MERAGSTGTHPGALRLRVWAVRARVAGLLVAVLAVVVPLLTASPAAAETPAPATTSDPQQRVVFLGIAGLSWPDITAEGMPTLYDMAGTEAAGSLTVRTVRTRTCVIDGWLTVSSGRRATDIFDTDGDGEGDRFCRQPPEPTAAPDGPGAIVPGWELLRQQQDDNSYNAEIGLLGDRLAETGVCATAVGPGAALALADSTGRVPAYHSFSGDLGAGLLSECPVTVVDLGGLPNPAPNGSDEITVQAALDARRQAAASIDQLVKRVIDQLPPDTALMIAGLADSVGTPVPLPDEPTPIPPAGLRAALASGPIADGGTFGPQWLTSSSTLWPGLVQLTDIAPTLLAYAGVDDPAQDIVGRPWRGSGEHPGTSAATVAELIGVDRASDIYRDQSGPFFQLLGGFLVVVCAAALLALRRGVSFRPVVLRVVQVVAVLVAAAPVASYLANITRWWRYDQPNTVLWTSIVVCAVALTIVALAGPWRRRVYGPPGVVAGVTATVLAVDVASGSSLQQSSLLGLSPLVAGRFYGFGNIPFAIFVVAGLVAAAALGQWLLDTGRSRRFAAGAVAVVGMIAVVIDGAPQAGADVGGILAAIPGFTVLVLGTLGARVTLSRLVLAAAGATALFGLFAFLDWLRPPGSRTHFGSFFADVLSGDALTVIFRKAEASLGTLDRWPIYGWLVPLAYLLILWLTRPDGENAVSRTVQHWSLFRYLVWAALLTGAAGFAANDSGIIVPALLLTVGVPLSMAAVAAAQRLAPASSSAERELTPSQ